MATTSTILDSVHCALWLRNKRHRTYLYLEDPATAAATASSHSKHRRHASSSSSTTSSATPTAATPAEEAVIPAPKLPDEGTWQVVVTHVRKLSVYLFGTLKYNTLEILKFSLKNCRPDSPYHLCSCMQIIDGGHFWAQFSDLKSKKRLRDLMEAITSRPLRPLIMDPRKMPGTYCLARYSGDGLFYRARILETEVEGKCSAVEVSENLFVLLSHFVWCCSCCLNLFIILTMLSCLLSCSHHVGQIVVSGNVILVLNKCVSNFLLVTSILLSGSPSPSLPVSFPVSCPSLPVFPSPSGVLH